MALRSSAILNWLRPPRVRGGPQVLHLLHAVVASTPAHAGRTRCRTEGCSASSFDPRACGADTGGQVDEIDFKLRPPRVRGGLTGEQRPRGCLASTPARAGRTTRGTPTTRCSGFDPRACGADKYTFFDWDGYQLRPPRVRGRRRSQGRRRLRLASTPARAGQTRSPPCVTTCTSFDPRACGADLPGHGLRVVNVLRPPRVRGRPLMICAYVT